MPALAPMTIGGLADKTGVDIESIRTYERLGFIAKPRRGPGGHVLYRGEDVEILAFVVRAQRLGFSFDAIGELLELAVLRDRHTCGDVHAVASRQLGEIRSRIADLTRMEQALAGLAGTCSRAGSVVHCPIIASLSRPA